MIPKINSAHGSDTRNIINAAIDSINVQGKSIQDLVAEGQLTPTQYATLIESVNGLISKGNVSKDDLNSELIQMLTEANITAEFLTVPRDHSVTSVKTDFLKVGKNKFKKEKVTYGKILSYGTGNLSDGTNYATQLEYIPTLENVDYYRSNNAIVVFYDENLDFLSGVVMGKGVYKTPVGTKYQRFSVFRNTVDTIQIEVGTQGTEYEPFKYVIEGLRTDFYDNSLDAIAIKDNTLDKEKLSFSVPKMRFTSNLFDDNESLKGKYVNQGNGEYYENADHTATNFIKIKGNTKYSFPEHPDVRIAFYDENRRYLTGIINPASPVESPGNAFFVVISYRTESITNFHFNEGETLLPYQPYGYTFENYLGEQNSGAEESLFINLPDKIPAVVGYELNIYFDNIISGDDTDYNFDVDFGGKGQHFERFFRFVPDVKENRTLTFKVLKGDKIIATKTTSIVVSSDSAGSGLNKKIVIPGDSTTNNGIAVTKLNENFADDPMSITMLGTRGTAPNNHEGRSGWTAAQFVNDPGSGEVLNAFYNPSKSTFDFSYYLTNNSIDVPDYFILSLGINDMFSYSTDSSAMDKITAVIGDYEKMIASVKARSSNIKIGIALTIPPNRSQDAFAIDYKTGQTRKRYKRNNMLLVKKMIEVFSNRETEYIYIIPTNATIDTKYNFGMVETKVNARNTETIKMPPGNSGVHPRTPGYWQTADAYYFWIKSVV